MPPRLDSVIKIGGRDSPLSKCQIEEVLSAFASFYPNTMFERIFVKTRGDLDKTTSLRFLERSDFFTRELDEMVLEGRCRVAVHSAKDLPDPLAKGLKIAALTKGVDPSDSLVFREGVTLATLPSGARIATSSLRRAEHVLHMRSDLNCVDIRGTMEERYAQLMSGAVEGVVMAEAALIRLGWTSLNRISLPGPSTPLQGRLAVVVKEEDLEMLELFRCLSST